MAKTPEERANSIVDGFFTEHNPDFTKRLSAAIAREIRTHAEPAPPAPIAATNSRMEEHMDHKMTTVESIYKVAENSPGEWIITKADNQSFLWSAQGWVRIEDGVYIVNFPSEADALTFAQQQPALHLPVSDITAPWKDWPMEHLLRKIEMPEGFVAELRKRIRWIPTAGCDCVLCKPKGER